MKKTEKVNTETGANVMECTQAQSSASSYKPKISVKTSRALHLGNVRLSFRNISIRNTTNTCIKIHKNIFTILVLSSFQNRWNGELVEFFGIQIVTENLKEKFWLK